MMDDLSFRSATALAALVRDRKIGCLELLDHYIARVERFDVTLNAVVVRDFDRARAAARALDAEPGRGGRLRGVPMTVKESYDVEGLPTTWGQPGMAENLAAADALAVARLKAEGAVVFGKTNVPLNLADWQSFNAVYGSTNNPWDLARSPGGSSGGSAASIAAGLAGLEMGSDIGGSIRQPAHACGVFGHKPTWGLVPFRGHSLAGAAAWTDISVCGPLARSAADLALALDIVGRPDPLDGDVDLVLPAGPTSLKGLKVAVWADSLAGPTDPEITASLLELAGALEREGVHVDRAARPDFDPEEAFAVYFQLLVAALSGRTSPADLAEVETKIAALAADDAGLMAKVLRANTFKHREWLALNERRHKMRRTWNALFREFDVLLCPAFGVPALPHMQDGDRSRMIEVGGKSVPYDMLLFWAGISCAFHLPATAAPLGQTAAGLPFGMQIVGPSWGDRKTIAVAALLERSWRPFAPPPGYG